MLDTFGRAGPGADLPLELGQLLGQVLGLQQRPLVFLLGADRAEALLLAVVLPQGAAALAAALLRSRAFSVSSRSKRSATTLSVDLQASTVETLRFSSAMKASTSL